MGRHVLIGAAAGSVAASASALAFQSLAWLDLPPPAPQVLHPDALLGMSYAVSVLVDRVLHGLALGLGVFLLLFVLRRGLRFEWLAAVATTAVLATPVLVSATTTLALQVVLATIALIPVVVATRYGLLATCACMFFSSVASDVSVTRRIDHWASEAGLFWLGVLGVLTFWAARASTRAGVHA